MSSSKKSFSNQKPKRKITKFSKEPSTISSKRKSRANSINKVKNNIQNLKIEK